MKLKLVCSIQNRMYLVFIGILEQRFNNYAINEENQLFYNEETDLYEAQLLLKQGFYNYRYVVVNDKGEVNPVKISGSNFETENDYLVIVYFRKFGEIYDRIIGIGSTNSSVIKN